MLVDRAEACFCPDSYTHFTCTCHSAQSITTLLFQTSPLFRSSIIPCHVFRRSFIGNYILFLCLWPCMSCRGEARKKDHHCQHVQVALVHPSKNEVVLIYRTFCLPSSDVFADKTKIAGKKFEKMMYFFGVQDTYVRDVRAKLMKFGHSRSSWQKRQISDVWETFENRTVHAWFCLFCHKLLEYPNFTNFTKSYRSILHHKIVLEFLKLLSILNCRTVQARAHLSPGAKSLLSFIIIIVISLPCFPELIVTLNSCFFHAVV